MPQYLPNFFSYYCLLLGSICLVFLIGHVLVSLFKTERYHLNVEIFHRFAIGLIAVIGGTAILNTVGQTIFLILPVIAAYLVFFNRKALKIDFSLSSSPLETKSLLLFLSALLLSSIIIFSWKYLQIYNPINGDYLHIHHDKFFYAKVIDVLYLFKTETAQLNILNPVRQPTLYHYAEPWLGVAIKTIFRTHSINTYCLLVIPLGIFGCYLGASAICQYFFKSSHGSAFIGITFLFCGHFFPGFSFHYLTSIFNSSLNTHNLLQSFYADKLFPLIITFCLSYIAYLNKKYSRCLLALLVGIPMYTPVLLAICFGTMGLAISLIIKKELSFAQVIKFIVLYLIAGAIFLNLYFFNTTSNPTAFELSQKQVLDYLLDFFNLRIMIMRIPIGYIGSLAILPLVYLLLEFLTNPQESLSIKNFLHFFKRWTAAHLSLILFIAFSITFCFGVAYVYRVYNVDAYQLVELPYVAIRMILIFSFWAFLLTRKSKKYRLVAVALFILFAVNTVENGFHCSAPIKAELLKHPKAHFYRGFKDTDLKFYNHVNQQIGKSQHCAIGAFMPPSMYGSNAHDYNEFTRTPLRFTSVMRDNCWTYKLSIYDGEKSLATVPTKDKATAHKRFASHVFTQFVSKQKKDSTFSSIGDSQIQFIKKAQISFLILGPKLQLPPKLKKWVKNTQINSTGWQFLSLKTDNNNQMQQ